jgi:hypothetical protein
MSIKPLTIKPKQGIQSNISSAEFTPGEIAITSDTNLIYHISSSGEPVILNRPALDYEQNKFYKANFFVKHGVEVYIVAQDFTSDNVKSTKAESIEFDISSGKLQAITTGGSGSSSFHKEAFQYIDSNTFTLQHAPIVIAHCWIFSASDVNLLAPHTFNGKQFTVTSSLADGDIVYVFYFTGDTDLIPAIGSAGPKGADGSPGSAATITIGTVSTGAAGSLATVTNVGDTSAAVFNFSIPVGLQGSPGIQGVQGVVGESGAVGETGPRGFTGATGDQGPPGLGITYKDSVSDYIDLPSSGVSIGDAYFVEDDGLLYIYGASGFPSDGLGIKYQGPIGERGEKGDTGDRGLVGERGIQGIAGPEGQIGPAGPPMNINYRGAWNSTINNYTLNDYVIHTTDDITNGYLYISEIAGELYEPTTNDLVWALFVLQGPRGAVGLTGSQGNSGNDGIVLIHEEFTTSDALQYSINHPEVFVFVAVE